MEHIHLKNEKSDAVEALAGGIAHDFNNLLTAIKGHASLMMNSVKPSDPLYIHIKQIIQCIDSGSEIANQLLGFAKADEYYTSSIDVNRLVRKIVEHLNLRGKGVILEVGLDSSALIIEADSDKICQAFNALLENALQAMPKGGKLSISTESANLMNGTAKAYGLESGLFTKITVTDTGIGMDRDTLENIFKPFYSADHKNHPDKKGLGLTFAREIVKNHKGVIDVWSSPNVGSSFSIILPLAEPLENVNFPSADQKLVLGNESVLLVDDEQRILTVGKEICKALGYKVITANSGKEALQIYKKKKEKINLVILDMIMPEMNGLETFLKLKKLNPDIKVLLSTGYSIDDKAQEMLKKGCKGYILKPYSVIDFSHKIREVLE
ncbi:hybrid sensor histidine kinase/response regulator [Desulfospira joergensenii]|uniref:hybrid sensor histidine kinase/response regulator n=1 Tax=Desulfospira joergensenii TaxID=53329 RepID=UPI0003B32EA4|nr:response regulator [Desulfospira joergensenii]